jgi:peroxiredoxin
VRLRGESASSRTAEWEAMIGALDRRAASIAVFPDECDTSTIIPSRLASEIACLPSSLTPPCSSSASPRFSRGMEESARSL